MKCFITGANRGIGLELARNLSSKGFEVFAAVRNTSEQLSQVPGVHILNGLDCESLESIENFFISHQLPKFDWVILNAGIFLETPLDGLDVSLVEKQIRVNAVAPVLISSKLLPYMKEGTRLALISSLMGSVADNTSGGYYGYRMSKSALNIAGKSLSVDLKNKGIIVSILHPGYVKTQMTDYMGNVPPDVSAAGMIRVIESTTLSASGSFYHYRGQTLPW